MNDVTSLDDKYKKWFDEDIRVDVFNMFPETMNIECGNLTIINEKGGTWNTKILIDGIPLDQVYEINLKININELPKLEVKRYCYKEKN